MPKRRRSKHGGRVECTEEDAATSAEAKACHETGAQGSQAQSVDLSAIRQSTDGNSCAACPEVDEVAILEDIWRQCLRSMVQSSLFPPLVLCEVQYRKEILKLRQHFASLLRRNLGETLGATPPREAFNRWLLERANRGQGREKVDSSVVAPGLYQEILEDIPMKVPHVFPADTPGQRKRLREFLDALQAWTLRRCPADTELQNAWESADKALRSDVDGMAIVKLLADLRQRIAPVVARVEGPHVAELISELEAKAESASHTVQALRQHILETCTSDADVDVTSDHSGHTLLSARIEGSDSEALSVSIGAPCLEHLSMLLQLTLARLSIATPGDEAEAEMTRRARSMIDGVDPARGGFWRLAFCTICRYSTLCGPGKGEGQGLQAAVPPSAFEAVARHLGVWPAASAPIECCASPLNCRATGACARGLFGSLCPDVDVFFGSFGSFFSNGFAPCAGLYEVNPPFELAVMERCSRKVLRLLEAAEVAGQGLVFVVFLPEWQTPWTVFAAPQPDKLPALDKVCSDSKRPATPEIKPNTPLAALLESCFCRGSLVARQQQHSYVHGLSYQRGQDGDRLMRATGKSRCIVLQTTQRFSSKAPTDHFWQDLKAAWRAAGSAPKRQRSA